MYKFVPYSPTSKIDCPYCKAKKRFVLFYDTDTGEIMPSEFGRCDRENGCGYYKHPLSNIDKGRYIPPIKDEPQKYIDKNIVEMSMNCNIHNNFIKTLSQKYGEEKVIDSVRKYYIGTSKTGGTAYFYVNHKKLVTSCKVILYNKLNRDKNMPPYYPYKTSDGYYACLFGLHLIDNNKKIKIVESEKTALIASMFYPDVVWMACGGTNGLTAKKCKDIKEYGYKHTIDLIPDCDSSGRLAAKKWQENLSVFGLDSNIIDLGEQYTQGEDLADLL